MRALPTTCALASVVLLCATTAVARASPLVVSTTEHGAWPDTVAALEADTAAEGTTVHVVVRSGTGDAVACGQYALALDAIGADRALERAHLAGTIAADGSSQR